MITLEQFTQLAHAQYKQTCGISVGVDGGKDPFIHCLKQGGVAADAVANISWLTMEKLAAPDMNDDDPFLTIDQDEDEKETNELTVKDMD